MGGFSLTHWLVVALVVVLLFGAGKLPRLMGDFAKGIKSFKSKMRDDEAAEAALAGSRTAEDRTPAESRLASPSCGNGIMANLVMITRLLGTALDGLISTLRRVVHFAEDS